MISKESILNLITKNRHLLATLALFIVFFCLRLYRLGYHDLWYDEVVSLDYAIFSLKNWNAPLYWILLRYWIKVFGISEFSLRFPSLIFSFFSVIMVYFLGKELFGKKSGIIASIFMGLSPFHLWYAQEARDYSMVLFSGLLSSHLLYKALKENRRSSWVFFALASIAGFYTNYFYAILFIAQALYVIFLGKSKLNFKTAFSFLVIIAGSLPNLKR
ncbi:glycosyltransferase family 39 protein [Candidatus Omnitrophota bacterium]